jgi:hypothetical protein
MYLSFPKKDCACLKSGWTEENLHGEACEKAEGSKTPQRLDSGSRNNVTGHSYAYSFHPRFETMTRERQEGGCYVIDFKDGQNFGEPQGLG